LLLLISGLIGLIITWRHVKAGSMIVLASGIGLAVVTYFISVVVPWVAAFFYGSPFIITGALCLVYHQRIQAVSQDIHADQ
jgi:hypothetical protein